jgi:hypothetical protein
MIVAKHSCASQRQVCPHMQCVSYRAVNKGTNVFRLPKNGDSFGFLVCSLSLHCTAFNDRPMYERRIGNDLSGRGLI